jgi:hypothetical protein
VTVTRDSTVRATSNTRLSRHRGSRARAYPRAPPHRTAAGKRPPSVADRLVDWRI